MVEEQAKANTEAACMLWLLLYQVSLSDYYGLVIWCHMKWWE